MDAKNSLGHENAEISALAGSEFLSTVTESIAGTLSNH